MHHSTISELYKDHKADGNASILKNSIMIDLKKVQTGGYGFQSFALYTSPDRTEERPFECYMQLLDTFYNEMKVHGDMVDAAKSYKDIGENWKQGKMSVPLTIGEGGVCQGKLGFSRNFYRLGVRMMTLTWNYPNELAFPNKGEMQENGRSRLVVDTENGLTETGAWLAREMECLGMIIDISHLNGTGIWDVFRHTKKPFVTSRSNARVVASYARNLTDEVIRTLAEKGRVVGINYYSCFSRDFAEGESEISRISYMVDHTKHIYNIGGIGCLGLGSDSDGIECELEVKGASQPSLLADTMSREGFSQSDIEIIFYKDTLGLYGEVL